MMAIQESILGKEFQAALDEIKNIRLKITRIQKKSWEMIRRLEPEIEELGRKIKRFIKKEW